MFVVVEDYQAPISKKFNNKEYKRI